MALEIHKEPPGATEQGVTRQLDQLWENWRIVIKLGLLDGQILKAVALTAATEVDVPHKLGRLPEGWIVVRNADAALTSLFESSDATTDFLKLTASASVTIDLYVF